jgi:hypothetical protein
MTAVRRAMAVAAVAATPTASTHVPTISGIVVILRVYQAVGVPVRFVWAGEVEVAHFGIIFARGMIHQE